MVVCDDCLAVLKKMSGKSVDMIYLDPPFFTQKIQHLKDVYGKEYAFCDVWNSRTEYLEYMKQRIIEMKFVLKDTGSIFLHCDDTMSHYLRIILDDIFGENNFRSEIIWTYKRWSNAQRGLLPGHQTILFYSKTGNFKFNTIYMDYSPTTNIDQILQERIRDDRGKVSYKCDKEGKPIIAKEKKGVPMSDVWNIPFLNPKAKERTGYPTQKPIELLQRIIEISTNEGDLVLDPFCGSGTTVVAAELMNRTAIGIDINAEAIEICRRRLEKPCKTESRLLKVGVEAYKTKTKDELELLRKLDCDVVQRNKGIDGFLKTHYQNAPVAVKIQKPTESFGEAVELLNNAGNKKNCSAMLLIKTADDMLPDTVIVPPNMIVIDDYKIQIEQKLDKLFKQLLISAI